MPKKTAHINPKDAKAVIMRLKGKSNPEIAKALGHKNKSKAVASAVVSKRLKRAKDSGLLPELLNKYGATDKAVIKTAVAALTAMETKFANYEGEITDSRDVIAHSTRLTAAKLIGEWKGWSKITLQNPDGSEISPINIFIADNGRDNRDKTAGGAAD